MPGSEPQPDPRELTDAERLELQDIAGRIACHRMSSAAILLLESLAPLHFLAGQAMVGLAPLASVVGFGEPWRRFAALVEKRGSVAVLLEAIQHAEEATQTPPDEAGESSEGTPN